MADKFIIHGAAFNGDGTSSAEATSNGGVGAWNNINIFQGTAPANGTLAGGDVVYVRSKASSGAAIVIAHTGTTLGSAAATEGSPITWVFDNGVVWPGVSGSVNCTSTSLASASIRDWNNLIAKDTSLVFGSSYTSWGDGGLLKLGKVHTDGIRVDMANLNGGRIEFDNGVHRRLSVTSLSRNECLFQSTWSGGFRSLTLYHPDIELLGTHGGACVFSTHSSGPSGQDPITVYGGRVYGAGAQGGYLVSNASGSGQLGQFRSFGLQYPRTMKLWRTPVAVDSCFSAYADGADGGFGSEFCCVNFDYTSRSDNNPPTLNASLETSGSQAWSYRLYPHLVSPSKPARLSVSKTWTQAPAARAITQEILWPVSLAAPDAGAVYMDVHYVDATTGEPRTISTQDLAGGTLSASTAAWSATTWGMVNLAKYKLSVNTPTPIKQDTAVLVTLFVASRSATVNDVLFVDPDPTFSAP